MIEEFIPANKGCDGDEVSKVERDMGDQFHPYTQLQYHRWLTKHSW